MLWCLVVNPDRNTVMGLSQLFYCILPMTYDNSLSTHVANHTNNLIKTAKREYFVNNFEINKSNSKETWKLINQLTSGSSKKSVNISEIKTGTNVINTPTEPAETFNLHFSTVGKKLAAGIQNENMEPEAYMQRTQHRFSLKAPTVSTVYKLLENINVRKATGLDGVSNKLLKFAAHIVAPSLTEIFTGNLRDKYGNTSNRMENRQSKANF